MKENTTIVETDNSVISFGEVNTFVSLRLRKWEKEVRTLACCLYLVHCILRKLTQSFERLCVFNHNLGKLAGILVGETISRSPPEATAHWTSINPRKRRPSGDFL
jgi:hypothetical protein